MASRVNHKKTSQSSKQKRGTKRNAADLLSTDNQADNVKNPRVTKRQRINERHAMTINALLSLSMDQIEALPEPLKKQALALRTAHCESTGVAQTNSNVNGAALNHDTVDVVDPDSSNSERAAVSEEDDQDDSFLHDQRREQARKQETVTHRRMPQQSQPIRHQESFVSQNNQHIHPRREAFNQFNLSANNQASRNTKRFSVLSSTPSQTVQLKQSQPVPINEYADHDDMDELELRFHHVGRKEMHTGSGRSCFCGFVCCFLFTVMVLAFVPTMPLYGGRDGTRFCDTNSKVIKAYNDTNCAPCPATALYCIKGKARCPDRSYWMNPDLQCVKRNVRDSLKEIGSACMQFVEKMRDFLGNEAKAWSSAKEWKQWCNKMTLEQFSRDYEMEIMVSFVLISWHFPCLRYLVIPIWARMVLAPLNGKDEDFLLRVAFRLLTYFCPIMFGYVVLNKFASLFS